MLDTKLPPLFKKIDDSLTTVEKVFNVASCALWFGGFSGPMRILFGQMQTISGIALTVFSEGMAMLSRSVGEDAELIAQWKKCSEFGAKMVMHGCLNFTRGEIEFFVNNVTFGVGNLLLVIPNIAFERNFKPYYVYEKMQQNDQKKNPVVPIPENCMDKARQMKVLFDMKKALVPVNK